MARKKRVTPAFSPFEGWQELDLNWDWPVIDWSAFEWEPLVIDWDFSGGLWTIPDTKTADKQVKTGKGRKPHASREKR